jgi:hypothetical protein
MRIAGAASGAVLDADFRADRVRGELDDNQIRRKPVVAIGNAGYLFGKCAVHESFDQ